MTPELPRPVAAYLAADRAGDTATLAGYFADDALVFDEEHSYRGLDAIRAWKQDVQAKYRYVMEPIEATVGDVTVTLHARLTGDFPGSPVEVDYTFTLANDKIRSLEIR
jgi:ketosteroid isomerase-like protein